MTTLKQLTPFGPIFGKELRATSRRKRTYWLRTIYLGALFLFLLLAYTSVSNFGGGTSVAERARREAELGAAFFATLSVFSVFAMPLIAPILTSTAISAERLGRTLHVLLMTPITSWQIVSGKLFSRLLVALTLLALNLPVLAVVRLLGGVELDKMLAVLLLCATVALTAAAVGLLFSTLINRAYAVILLSYVTMFFFYGLVPFLLALLMEASGARRGPPRVFITFLSVTNPMFQVINMTFNRGLRLPGAWSWGYCAAFHLVVAGALVPFTGRVLRRRVRREGDAAGAGPLDETPPPVVDGPTGKARRARAARGVGENPVLWRELRRPLFVKRWQAVTSSVLGVALLLFTYVLLASQYTNELTSAETHFGYACVFYTLVLLLACVLAGTAVTGEKDSDTWTLLLATPLRGHQVVRGKVGGVLRRVMWPAILFGAHLVVFALAGVLSWIGVVAAVWVTVTFTSVWIALGIYFSLRLKNNTFAVVVSLILPLCAFAGVPLVLAILENLANDRGGRLPEVSFFYLPYYYLYGALVRLPGNTPWSLGSSISIDMPGTRDSLTADTFLGITFVAGLAHLVVAWVILTWIGRRFDRLVHRAPQSEPLPERTLMGVVSPS